MTCKNEDGLEFSPFNDTDQPRIQQMILSNEVAEQGMDTRVIDAYRQGVSIRTPRHRFAGMQPKIGTDSSCHYTKIVTYGQARDFTQYNNSSIFTDKDKFETLAYLDNPEVFYPILLNGGPQNTEESQIEPLTIPFKKNEYFENYKPHAFRGSLEDGNASPILGAGNNRIQQFVPYQTDATSDLFVDEGSEEIGGIIYDGYASFAEVALKPFDDTVDEEIVKQVFSQDTAFLNALKALDYDLSEDIRESFDRKSAAAGSSVYGPNQARYGTDSIAYVGLLRGS